MRRSLLGLPYLDPQGEYFDKEIYQRTRAFVHSRSNTPEPRPVSAHGAPPTGSPKSSNHSLAIGAAALVQPLHE